MRYFHSCCYWGSDLLLWTPTTCLQRSKMSESEKKNQWLYKVLNVQTAFYSIYYRDLHPTHRADSHYIRDLSWKFGDTPPYDHHKKGVVMVLQVCEQIFACNISPCSCIAVILSLVLALASKYWYNIIWLPHMCHTFGGFCPMSHTTCLIMIIGVFGCCHFYFVVWQLIGMDQG